MRWNYWVGAAVLAWGTGSGGIGAERHDTAQGVPDGGLLQLNHAYIIALNQLRQQQFPGCARVRFNAKLLQGAVAHNQRLDHEDTLYHELGPFAELVGTLYNAPSREPAALARYILTQLQHSPPHRAIQQDTSLRSVALSATSTRYVVRLRSAAPVRPSSRRR